MQKTSQSATAIAQPNLALTKFQIADFQIDMNLFTLRTHCLSKPGTTEEYPFGPETIVFKVMGKMFALTNDELQPKSVNLKCDPDDSLALRRQFSGVREGYHMDHRHWITVDLNSDVPINLLHELINDSYELVVAKLPKKDREALKAFRNF